jgi:hypothetical protein
MRTPSARRWLAVGCAIAAVGAGGATAFALTAGHPAAAVSQAGLPPPAPPPHIGATPLFDVPAGPAGCANQCPVYAVPTLVAGGVPITTPLPTPAPQAPRLVAPTPAPTPSPKATASAAPSPTPTAAPH